MNPDTPPLAGDALAALQDACGRAHVLTSVDERRQYSHDKLPYSNFMARTGSLTGTLPSAVVRPGDAGELRRVVTIAVQKSLRLIPYGAGSGVLGGVTPLCGEVTVDLQRMNRLLAVDEYNGTATVQAGMNGAAFEQELNRRGFTCGHLPQSIEISTVGGWLACRGAGQASSRFGKIEDIAIGLKAILADGRELDVRPVPRRSVGPSIKDLLIGSEGVFGFITEATLRIWKLPEHQLGAVFGFATLEQGLEALREIMQSELRPQVARMYDEHESRLRTEGLAEFEHHPILCLLKFSGLRELAEVEYALAGRICLRHGAIEARDAPLTHWESVRFQSLSKPWQDKGYYNDTIEVAADWRVLPDLYRRLANEVAAIEPSTHFGAHWSHAYPEGACQYMTIRLPPMPQDRALPLHRALWNRVQGTCLEMGATIAHHHGVGVFRNPWLRIELNTGMDLLQILKDGLDPGNLLNPGKLGLRGVDGAVVVEAAQAGGDRP
ncbi:MAG: FAD-binding oxidoreductase [Burkholderiaceae bacterium]